MGKALYDVPAPAKLNLFLHLVGRRLDGYHKLETVFRFIDLQDTLNFERRNDGQIVRAQETLSGLAAEDDLMVRAARLLQHATGTSYGVELDCVKRIPAGGGLGGGSSDAASTLIALNKLWETGLSRAQLMRLAVQLGADVPVFVFGQNAFATGIGEQLRAVSLPPAWYTVVQPNAFVSTAEIFADKGLTRNSKSVIITFFDGWRAASHKKSEKETSSLLFGRNDMEPIACKNHVALDAVIRILRNNNLHVRMTGSGSCVFVEYSNYATASSQNRRISGKLLNLTHDRQLLVKGQWLSQGLDYHPLYSWLK
ncbi:4-(cytidine 5'-diphospho)-2-C-methyl-D-erythritol kinase [Paenalcaligenes sp. Me131]|uniref:4-(cytidine 5'-diphospho)-2-C-methyl-D-erythritol kinase n=1 Tax=Paenalcaligenes sp. Me131 TaxID=3392636 RepID=UPI003D2ACC72